MNGHRILIIENNTFVREAFELTLKSSGLEALAVSTAEEGLEAVRQKSFDVIISDHHLPDMDGLEFFAKAREYTPESTKVLISAYGFNDIDADAKAVGVSHFFVKPFSIQKLLCQLNLSTDQPPQQLACTR
jgi:CheY-like chemotaxis protein